MARVNRTTGMLLILVVVLLVGTVAGALYLPKSATDDVVPEDTRRPDAYGRGRVDSEAGISSPVPGVQAGIIAAGFAEGRGQGYAGQTLYRLGRRPARAAG